MALVDVTFVDDTGSEMEANVEDNWTTQQVIDALIDANFVPPAGPTRNYELTIKGRNLILDGQTLAAAGIRPNDRVRVSAKQMGGRRETHYE